MFFAFRCSLTQGKALGHSYVDWALEGTELSSKCEICGSMHEKTAEEWVEDLLQVNWGAEAVRYAHKDYTSTEFLIASGVVVHYITAGMGIEDLDVKLEDGVPVFSFNVVLPDESQRCEIRGVEDPVLKVFDFFGGGNDEWVVFGLQKKQLEYLTGGFGACTDTEYYFVELAEDHTFTGHLGAEGEVVGIWTVTSLDDFARYNQSEGEQSLRSRMVLNYICGEEVRSAWGEIYIYHYIYNLTENGVTTQEKGESMNFYITPWESNESLQFNKTDRETLEAALAAKQEGPELLAGRWKGVVYENLENSEGAGDSWLEFYEDGSFEGLLDREVKGSWEIEDVEINQYGSAIMISIMLEDEPKHGYQWRIWERETLNVFTSDFDVTMIRQ